MSRRCKTGHILFKMHFLFFCECECHVIRVCLGSDCNARICMLEEMRWLEYCQRLKTGRRGVLARGDPDIAINLLAAATVNGARSLGVSSGSIEPGFWADMIAVDLDHPMV